ncbi:MAG: gephyrin-like molybdotransferase Glp [Burkholderiaceae bacterium]|jgi:molybdopterin molybdotransferase
MDSKPTLLSVEEALVQLLAAVAPVSGVETVPIASALGRVLSAPQVSRIDVPPADNTQMDGYAIRASDCASGQALLAVSQRIPAGHVGQPLVPNTAARIFTGGLIPEGADAVVMQEQTEASSAGGGPMVTIRHVPAPGDWIRRAGEDIRAGATILEPGTRLRPQEIGLAASVGITELPVRRRIRVAIFFTGDELAMPGEKLRPGAIYNSSRFTLNGLLSLLGCDTTDLGIVPDTREATRAALRTAAAGHDCIITSGGVSVGEEDHVKPAVEAEGRLDLWQIAIKPGKPLAFGKVADAVFLGLPGNPVSSFVAFLLFVRPVLLRLQGAKDARVRRYAMRADFNWPKPDRRQEYLRVRVNDAGGLDLFPNQGSAVLTSTVWGHGLLENPPGHAISHGDIVQFIPFAESES